MEEECRFCKQYGLGVDGFICNKTGKKVAREDCCNDFEVVE